MAWSEAALRLQAPPKLDARGASVSPGNPIAAVVLSRTALAGRRTRTPLTESSFDKLSPLAQGDSGPLLGKETKAATFWFSLSVSVVG